MLILCAPDIPVRMALLCSMRHKYCESYLFFCVFQWNSMPPLTVYEYLLNYWQYLFTTYRDYILF